MKDISMFEYAVELAASADAADLGDVSCISRRDFDERTTFRFRSQVPCLEYASLLIENALLLRTNRAGRVYVGFEKLSRMEAVADRYLRIADISERVYVFGEPDWKPPRHPNMRVIALGRESRLAREWFVIAASPSLRVALVAFDENGPDHPVREGRTLRAIKTDDDALVERLAGTAEDLIDDSINS